MIKELGLVVTGVVIGTAGTLYLTRELLGGPIAEKLIGVMEEIIDEEVESAKDEMHIEQVEKDNRRDYTKPLRKSGKYPWGEHTNQRKDKAFTTRYEAATILNKMTQHCNTYGQVTLADYYKLIGQTPTNVDDNYGWTDLSGATISEIGSGGYTIHMPVAKKLNK